MASVNWTDHAIHSLDGIHGYLHEEAPFYANHIVQKILASTDMLEDHPLAGRQVPEAEREDIREVICKGYRVIYRVVSTQQPDVIAVVHSRRDLADPATQPWNH